MLNWKLLTGPIPWIVWILGIAGAGVLLYGRRRGWWQWRVPVALLIGAVVAVAVYVVFDVILKVYPPQGLGPAVTIASGVMAAAVMLLLLKQTTWRRRWPSVLAVLAVVLGSASYVNQYFEYYPDIRAALGVAPEDTTALPAKNSTGPGSSSGSVTPTSPSGPLVDNWNPPSSLPANGTISEVTIPATASGWQAQRQWVYLPPAAYADNAPDLPVMVLLPGDPGSPDQWALGLDVQGTFDTFAAAHKGLAPIVVMPDSRGTNDDPGCMNSPRGNVFTYLTVDLPAFIKARVVHATADTAKWAIGGLSEGGLCGLAATVDASVYSTFLSYSGELELSLASKQDAINTLFGGDTAAYAKLNPGDVLKAKKFPSGAGFVSVGRKDDPSYANAIRDAATAAGMKVEYQVVDGGHDNDAFREGMVASVPWVAQRFGMTP